MAHVLGLLLKHSPREWLSYRLRSASVRHCTCRHRAAQEVWQDQRWEGVRHLQEAWLSFMSLASCSVFSSAGAEPSQICLNSGTRSFSLNTCSARCRSRNPTATSPSASGRKLSVMP